MWEGGREGGREEGREGILVNDPRERGGERGGKQVQVREECGIHRIQGRELPCEVAVMCQQEPHTHTQRSSHPLC